MSETNFDLIVVGGGPGGYVAAIRAAQLGLKTALVEKEHLGGVCLNWGCIPTKALLRSAEIMRTLGHLDQYGLKAGAISFDMDKVVARSRGVAAQLSGGVKHLLKKNKITVFDGHAALDGKAGDKRKLKVTKDGKPVADLTAAHVILATGARPRTLPGIAPEGKVIWTSKEALVPNTTPKSLLVIGSGAIGIEFASFFSAFGTKVTVVEVADRVLPAEDEEISALAHKQFEKQGMTILTKAMVKAVKVSGEQATATIDQGGKISELTVDRVILAVGIVGNVEGIGLEGTAIKVENTHVITDPYCRTGEPGVYAIGDLCGPPWLAHKASHEGVICVEKIAGLPDVHPLQADRIPGCTYCTPQVASVGLTEAKAKAAGHKVKVGRFPFIGNGKAIALGEPDGMMKTVFDVDTGELLGAHLIGAEVTEMIQGFTIAKSLETTELDLMHTVFPHPTLSEMMHEATLSAYGRAIHF